MTHGKKAIYMILIMSAMLFAGMMLVSCEQIGDITSGSSEKLVVAYEGYAAETTELDLGNGPVETREHYFIMQNATDKTIHSAEVNVFGLDGNGKRLKRSEGETNGLPTYLISYLMPGEYTIVESFDAEWVEIPASFEFVLTKLLTGSDEVPSLSVTDAVQLTPYAWDLTLRNDGAEEILWVNDFSGEDFEVKRLPMVAAVVTDDAGNVESVDIAVLLDGDQIMTDNFTIAPGEEKTVVVCFSAEYQDPEFIICWY